MAEEDVPTPRAVGGCAPPSWARTTGYCPRRAWCWAWRQPMEAMAALVVAGVAGLVAGGMSMAAGEYVSVHSQADTEAAALKRAPGTHRRQQR